MAVDETLEQIVEILSVELKRARKKSRRLIAVA